MINVSLEKSVNSKDWARRAVELVKAECEKLGVNFKACEAFVSLPERGRCFVKPSGATSFTAHG